MSQIRAYFERLLLTALASPHVNRVERLRQEEDATGTTGFMRYRLTLSKSPAGHLIKRWDNAPHHPDVPSFPHHLHDGAEAQVVAHPPVDALHILTVVLQSIEPSRKA